MSPKNRKTKAVGKNLADEWAQLLSTCEHPLLLTKKMLKDKPHFTSVKNTDVPAAMSELKDLSVVLSNLLLKDEDRDKNSLLMCAMINFVKVALEFEENFDLINIGRVVSHLSLLLTCRDIPPKVKTHISILSERYVEISIIDEHLKVSQCLVNYLLDLTLSKTEPTKKIDIKRVWSLRKFIDIMDVDDPDWEMIVSKYLSTLKNVAYLTCREGQHVVGYLMRKSVQYVKKVHDIIMNNTPKITKAVAVGYGQAYFVAWRMSKDEVQTAVEECLQSLIIKVINIPRAGVDFPKAGANGFAILSTLHSCRRMKNFSHVLNSLYSPVVWRLLRDSDPWKRCNAAQIFFDVFPLEDPYSSAVENANYLDRQLEEIQNLLMDESHFVRVIAIKGFCYNMNHSLELFNVLTVKYCMTTLAVDLINDGSSYLVRKAVFEGFESMLHDATDAEDGSPYASSHVLEKVLQGTSKSLFDDNEKVRKAYVKLLLKLKERSKYLKIRYWEVVPIPNIIHRLATEGPMVGELLTKLVIEQMICKKKPKVDFIVNRLCSAIDINFEGVKNAFKHSHKVLSVNDAYRLIVSLVGTVRKTLKEFLDSLDKSNTAATPAAAAALLQKKKDKAALKRKNRKGDAIEEESSEDEDNENRNTMKDQNSSISSTSSVSDIPPKSEYEFLGRFNYIRGLIQLSTIIWVVFRKEISEEPEYLNNLYNLASGSIPMLLKHYKGTSVYYATVSFASLIPIQKLRPVSTISSACISELKEVTEETDSTKMECLIYALCSWNRGHDVLDLISEWLNFAFREQNLNNTALTKKTGQKVRFQQISGKPLLALRLLDVLFSDVINEQRILNKNYEQLLDFYSCLERILIIIERKMAGCEGFDKPGTTLTDEFISKAFCRYMRLMHSLHQGQPTGVTSSNPPVPFDAAAASLKTIIWARDVLFPRIPLEAGGLPPLAAQCCLSVLREATLSITLGETNEEHCRALCLFTTDILALEGSWFLDQACATIQAVAEHAESFTPNDEWLLLSQILPCLLEKALAAMTNIDVDLGTFNTVIEDVVKFKAALFCLPKMLLSRYGEQSVEFMDVYKALIRTCMLLLLQEINYEETVLRHSKLEDLPCFVTIILKNILYKSFYMKHLIPILIYHIEEAGQRQDGMGLLSGLSILYTIITAAKKRFQTTQLEDALFFTYDIFSKYRPKEKPVKEDSFSDASIEIDVKKVGIPVIQALAKFINSSLYNQGPVEEIEVDERVVSSKTKDVQEEGEAKDLSPTAEETEVTPEEVVSLLSEEGLVLPPGADMKVLSDKNEPQVLADDILLPSAKDIILPSAEELVPLSLDDAEYLPLHQRRGFIYSDENRSPKPLSPSKPLSSSPPVLQLHNSPNYKTNAKKKRKKKNSIQQ